MTTSLLGTIHALASGAGAFLGGDGHASARHGEAALDNHAGHANHSACHRNAQHGDRAHHRTTNVHDSGSVQPLSNPFGLGQEIDVYA